MADLTIAKRFGANAQLNETTKVLSIQLNDLATINLGGINLGLDASGITATNKDAYASKILWALLLLSQSNQAASNNDETVKLYITNQGKRDTTRNNVAQFGYQLVATAYQNDSLGVNLDPDSMA
jgi:hypothetical protein